MYPTSSLLYPAVLIGKTTPSSQSNKCLCAFSVYSSLCLPTITNNIYIVLHKATKHISGNFNLKIGVVIYKLQMVRIKLSEKFHNEREELCKKLIAIVGTEFYLSDLDEDIEKQNTILALKDEIQKVFAVSTISSFKPCLANDVKRDALNVVRGILKQQGYTFEGIEFFKTYENGLFKRTTKYKIFRE
jgi:hypothetical protein